MAFFNNCIFTLVGVRCDTALYYVITTSFYHVRAREHTVQYIHVCEHIAQSVIYQFDIP